MDKWIKYVPDAKNVSRYTCFGETEGLRMSMSITVRSVGQHIGE